MTIAHHPQDEFLLSYAVGALAYPTQIVLATHLSLCDRCRDAVNLLERIGGAMLERLEDVPLSPSAVSAVFERLDATEDSAVPLGPTVEDLDTARVLPVPLRAFVGKPLRALAWQDRAPGIVVARLTAETEETVRAVMIHSRSGARYPAHDHTGAELAIPLTGGWSDEYGHFLRGDLSVREPGEPHHAIVVDDGEDCLAFSVVDETLVPRG